MAESTESTLAGQDSTLRLPVAAVKLHVGVFSIDFTRCDVPRKWCCLCSFKSRYQFAQYSKEDDAHVGFYVPKICVSLLEIKHVLHIFVNIHIYIYKYIYIYNHNASNRTLGPTF